MPDVWFVPGFTGSELGSAAGGAERTWLDYTRLGLGGARRLPLAADGVAPLPPDGRQQYTGGLVSAYYGAAAGLLRQQLAGRGLTMDVFTYDWRLRTRGQGELLAQAIRTSANTSSPGAVVAHSHGGLVARAAWASLVASGDQALVRRVVTMGTPHFGTWRVGQLWTASDDATSALVLLSAARVAGLGAASVLLWGLPYTPDELVRITQTWPALFEVSPSMSGPDAAADPFRSTFYNSTAWPRTRRPSQPWLDYSRGEWAMWLTSPASLPPSWVLTTVAGTGFPTPARLLNPALLGYPAGIGNSFNGDGTVTTGSALLPNAAQLTVSAAHADLPLALATDGTLLDLILAIRNPPDPPPPPVVVRTPPIVILSGPPLPGPGPFADP